MPALIRAPSLPQASGMHAARAAALQQGVASRLDGLAYSNQTKHPEVGDCAAGGGAIDGHGMRLLENHSATLHSRGSDEVGYRLIADE
jgi:hypothetical protein